MYICIYIYMYRAIATCGCSFAPQHAAYTVPKKSCPARLGPLPSPSAPSAGLAKPADPKEIRPRCLRHLGGRLELQRAQNQESPKVPLLAKVIHMCMHTLIDMHISTYILIFSDMYIYIYIYTYMYVLVCTRLCTS